jgi:catechol 2,3-dioxygenase-like lactoylglutathione lyase family enzyme
MTITLNHTIVPARDKEASAEFFARIFGLKVESPVGHFAVCDLHHKMSFLLKICFKKH